MQVNTKDINASRFVKKLKKIKEAKKGDILPSITWPSPCYAHTQIKTHHSCSCVQYNHCTMHLYSVKITTCYKNITHLILCSIQISSNCTIENFSHSIETLLHFHAWTIGPWRKWNSAYTVWILELPYTTTSTSQTHAVPWQHTYNMWHKQRSFDVPCSVKAMESLFFFIFLFVF